MDTLGPIFLIDDEEHIRISGKQTLELAGYEVTTFDEAEKALDALSLSWPGVVVSDIKMPGMDGLNLMKAALEKDSQLPFVLITGHGDVALAVDAMRNGAYDFIEKPFPADHLTDIVSRAMERRQLVMENRTLKEQLKAEKEAHGPTLLGEAPAIKRLKETIGNIADSDASVLVVGETGTGKELVARRLHETSLRHRCHFVPLNCAAMPEALFESELFGHEEGAFHGANTSRIGKIEHSNGGTLFLDEIESMPVELQAKLLRALQEREIVRLGSNQVIPVNLRVVAATKADLKERISEGLFREDLFYRLNVAVIQIPPLRERREDIPLLFSHFAQSAPPLEQERMGQLMAYAWQGNVRELKNVAERYVINQDAPLIEELDLLQEGATETAQNQTLVEQVRDFEKSILIQHLSANKGNVKATIEALGLPRKTFYDKMTKYDLDRRDFE
ncbi:MAG: sigma-54 dependent transcriptional regulator [Alphaproteobacteria bacterium]|nr:sigma-54 dependent transcriptional regulator [Alphaproteobacteria bacterium]